MRSVFCILALLAGPWLAPAWYAPTLELDHLRDAQLVPERVFAEQGVTSPKPIDGYSGDQASGSNLGYRPEIPRQYPARVLTFEELPHPTRHLLINAHASSFL